MTPCWGRGAARGQLGWMSGRPYTPVEGGLGSGELYFDIAIVTTQLQN